MGTRSTMAFMGGQEESIYCLIPPVIEPPPKPPLYRSKYPGTVPANKKPDATMGPLKVKAPDPQKFLKAYTREDNKLPEPRKFEYKDTIERRPGVPGRTDKPVMGLVTSKNFITCNAVENILAVPKKTDVRQVSYMNKKGYGKVPAYLEKVKARYRMNTTTSCRCKKLLWKRWVMRQGKVGGHVCFQRMSD